MILLDTDVCIELLRGNKNVLIKRNEENDDIAVSFMTVAELYYGAYKSNNVSKNNDLISEFLLTVPIIHTDIYILQKFGEIKSNLENKGLPITDADILIASTALIKCQKLITGNIKHYNRIEELRIENWIQ